MNRDLTPYAPTARAALQTAAIVRRLMCSALHEETVDHGRRPENYVPRPDRRVSATQL
jgi:hypothetical protein